MEDNRLNFNRPLLSVRRHSKDDDRRRIVDSIEAQISHGRSELKSGPVRIPGVVPFQWEQSPGKPKEAVRTVEGRIKGGEEEEEDDDDEAYVDALDTLSRAESSFLNCSFNGLTVLENSDVKSPSGMSSRDPQMLALVMDRFLPATKAMVQCEAPQCNIVKKPTANSEQLHDEAKKTMVVRKDKPLLRYGPSFANRYAHYGGAEEKDDHDEDEEEEDSDSDDDYGSGHGYLPPICGLLPRFCSKGSIGIISPAPRARLRTARVPKSTEMEKKATAYGGPSQRYVRKRGVSDDRDNDSTVSTHRAHRYLMDTSSEDIKKWQEFQAADSRNSDKASSEIVISPPLPKSPSDSWLWRTLPTVISSTKNTPRPFGAETDVTAAVKPSSPPPYSGATKWEAIVKTAEAQNHK